MKGKPLRKGKLGLDREFLALKGIPDHVAEKVKLECFYKGGIKSLYWIKNLLETL